MLTFQRQARDTKPSAFSKNIAPLEVSRDIRKEMELEKVVEDFNRIFLNAYKAGESRHQAMYPGATEI